jgi:ATP phosphoribosyltransferase-like protein
VVVAAPGSLLEDGRLPKRTLIVASELARLTLTWIERTGVRAQLVHSYGATEVFPPEDSDLIVDISASGQTLEANGLTVVETLMSSSTRLYASRQAMDDPLKKEPIQALALSLQSVLDARGRAMVELNVFADDLERIVGLLPSMREPTIATLHGGGGYAIKAAVPRSSLTALIPWLKESGATDIVVSSLEQIVP